MVKLKKYKLFAGKLLTRIATYAQGILERVNNEFVNYYSGIENIDNYCTPRTNITLSEDEDEKLLQPFTFIFTPMEGDKSLTTEDAASILKYH